MALEFLQRADAPFGAATWARIDETVVAAARSQMTARRLLDVEGPYGLGLKVLTGTDLEQAGGVGLSASIPVPTLRESFAIPIRDIANFEQTGIPFPLAPVAQAAVAAARREDELIFRGLPDLGIPGLLTVPGTSRTPLKAWAEPGAAFEDVLAAVNKLDAAGFPGPYALALAPVRYNQLFRVYAGSQQTEYQQLQMLVTGGIVKAPVLEDGGVLVAVGPQFISIVIGQDLATGFVGPAGDAYEFILMESLVLRPARPEAVCIIAA